MKYILLLLAPSTISCNENKRSDIKREKVKHVSITKSNILLDAERVKQLKAAAFNGDTIAYNELSEAYADMGAYDDFLFVSMTVAHRYSFSQAMFDVYQCFSSAPLQVEKSDYAIDSVTKNLALFYLLKSYELGYTLAKKKVEIEFENQKIPSSTYYLNEYKNHVKNQ